MIALFIGAFLLFIEPPRTDYYAQIDNTKYEENRSDGGVVDFTGKMEYLYTLKSYTADGKEKEITFGTDKALRENAYIKLEYTLVRGVVAWSEGKWDELPEKLQSIYPKQQ